MLKNKLPYGLKYLNVIPHRCAQNSSVFLTACTMTDLYAGVFQPDMFEADADANFIVSNDVLKLWLFQTVVIGRMMKEDHNLSLWVKM